MASLTDGLVAAGFVAGPERLSTLVQALVDLDFQHVDDLEYARGWQRVVFHA